MEDDADQRRQLSAIPGLDLTGGLAMVRGKVPLYRRLLALFVDQHGGEVERLRERLQAGDLVEIQRLAHTLKGSAGHLGATRVQTAADALQAAIRHGAGRDDIDHCFKAVAAELSPLLDGIRAALVVEGHPAPVTTDPIRLAAVLGHMELLPGVGEYHDQRASARRGTALVRWTRSNRGHAVAPDRRFRLRGGSDDSPGRLSRVTAINVTVMAGLPDRGVARRRPA